MPAPAQWDAASATRACPVVAWEGTVWRMHKQKYAATDPGGSRRISGRYHRGLDTFPEEAVWAALYFGTREAICLAEMCRHLEPQTLSVLNSFRLTELQVHLTAVLDCRNPTLLGLTLDDLIGDRDYSITQDIGAAAYAAAVEGLLVPSATGLGDNLILFPIHLGARSQLTILSSCDPRLYPTRV